ncbi:hypothetical protein [Tersicoccus sp. Bi-70]|uniref:hypothetical protein n=1 Tax=Tersicoccus sp. Bi-70 TaxID=1897634 RepID=UPI00117D967C|nr:hypothetical protein [Tersicoccus sp. Bi-70]
MGEESKSALPFIMAGAVAVGLGGILFSQARRQREEERRRRVQETLRAAQERHGDHPLRRPDPATPSATDRPA